MSKTTDVRFDEAAPPESDGVTHLQMIPSRKFCRKMVTGPDDEYVMGEYLVGGTEWTLSSSVATVDVCGQWQFAYEKGDGVVVEQCTGCGEYRDRKV